jgi:hypothetical protein
MRFLYLKENTDIAEKDFLRIKYTIVRKKIQSNTVLVVD